MAVIGGSWLPVELIYALAYDVGVLEPRDVVALARTCRGVHAVLLGSPLAGDSDVPSDDVARALVDAAGGGAVPKDVLAWIDGVLAEMVDGGAWIGCDWDALVVDGARAGLATFVSALLASDGQSHLTPVHLVALRAAAAADAAEVVEAVTAAAATRSALDVKRVVEQALMMAAAHGADRTIAALLARDDCPLPGPVSPVWGEALTEAALNGHSDVVAALLPRIDGPGYIAIVLAAAAAATDAEHFDVAALLLDASADQDQPA
ncbi:uncharacterized protein AMSG_06336 [Thecamonas trahens ATCC 50062]|uniref:Uncharacterized protein n=1 Tax=Thecamonas trahens ATCC 50062 TaxID=461836 RepID=A0A0L0DDK4_THETB|nr:hypothetical protein AMSG_06336 [Thecamonas trahens ATCC 50062]KNC50191.1 hypothetical protein AMSG_06336 [Thecamonas trahens ATCC 50062]|eukprot:XP_013757028.1 hypothetical protein AMSG_06336 [Thecamonas trahens ATCC 50062]